MQPLPACDVWPCYHCVVEGSKPSVWSSKGAENLLYIGNGYAEIAQMLIMSFGDKYNYENWYNVLGIFMFYLIIKESRS